MVDDGRLAAHGVGVMLGDLCWLMYDGRCAVYLGMCMSDDGQRAMADV